MNGYYKCPATNLSYRSPKGRCEVSYDVSYEYNGGVIVENEWYKGFEVPPPILPEGYELHNIGVGLQLNAQPPYATALLVKKEET